MHIHYLEISAENDLKLRTAINNFTVLIDEIKVKAIPEEVCYKINSQIDFMNTLVNSDESKIKKKLEITYHKILLILRRDLGIVPENYYRNLYLALGMSVFGLPIGALIAFLSGNYSFLAIGMLFGLSIGVLVGAKKDKIADEENKVIKVQS